MEIHAKNLFYFKLSCFLGFNLRLSYTLTLLKSQLQTQWLLASQIRYVTHRHHTNS